MPTVRAGTHRGNVCEVLSTDEWMDCADVAEELGWSRNGASKVLADVWRENYVRRRQIRGTRPHDGDFEYQIFEEVTVE